ncbi:MAG: class I SAM-dependent methyltransferase [Planctomycetota bacterium JB042]
MTELYDTIGAGYAPRRVSDPRIARRLRRCLADGPVVNVGAGAGSYEPADLPTVAVEPSMRMIAQRRSTAPVVRATAERLPFRDGAFDSAMAVLTVHHWPDPARGLSELARVARRSVAVMTWDPAAAGWWLVDDLFPELLAIDRAIFPPLDLFRAAWGRIEVETVPVPADCTDGFLGAYWRRPEAYLDPAVRGAMSTFARVPEVEARVERLRADLASGAWARRHRRLLDEESLDVGYRIVRATRR